MAPDADAVDVRPLSAEHFDEFRAVMDYAFHPNEGPQEYDEAPERIADRYGAFDGDDLVSVCGHYDFTANLRGEWVALAGLAAVFPPLMLFGPGLLGLIGQRGISINLLLAGFNMSPYGPLDGKKVVGWSKSVYLAVAVPSVLLAVYACSVWVSEWVGTLFRLEMAASCEDPRRAR